MEATLEGGGVVLGVGGVAVARKRRGGQELESGWQGRACCPGGLEEAQCARSSHAPPMHA